MVVVSSNDEFMQFDWTNLWFDKAQGETHLLIVPNMEHSCATGAPEIMSSVGMFVQSIASGK